MITRPSTYRPSIAARICSRIAQGETLAAITGPHRPEGAPSRDTVHRWLRRFRGFRIAYRLARLAQAELWADRLVELADGLEEEGLKPEDLHRDRLGLQERDWLSAVRWAGAVGPMPPKDETELAQLVAEVWRVRREREGRRFRRSASGLSRLVEGDLREAGKARRRG